MVKYMIDGFAVVQSVTATVSLSNAEVAEVSATQVAQIDCYTAGVLHGCLHFYLDGLPLLPPPETIGEVVHMHCNSSQFLTAYNILQMLQLPSEERAPVFVYYRNEMDCGLHCGKDPFDQPGPISF